MNKTILSLSILNLVLQASFTFATLYQAQEQTCQEPLRLYLITHIALLFASTVFDAIHRTYDQSNKASKWLHFILRTLSVTWFLYGNYLLFYSSAVTCFLTAPAIFNMSCVALLYGYIIHATPAFAMVIQDLILPCVLDILQLLHIIEPASNTDYDKNDGASEKDISILPVYHLASEKGLSSGEGDNAIPQLTIANDQDKVCVICLGSYEENDVICKLWCKHHFHKMCIADWLALNALCPLCKRDCRDLPTQHQQDQRTILPL